MKFKVLLRGEKFFLSLESGETEYGFYKTVTVKASNARDAEETARILVLEEIEQYISKDNVGSNTSELVVEDISRAKWWSKVGGKGFTFWLEESESGVTDQ